MRRRIAPVLVFVVLALASGARATVAEGEPGDSPEALVERILELEREIERLLAQLPPDARAELEARRRERRVEPESEQRPPLTAAGEAVASAQEPVVEAPAHTPRVAPLEAPDPAGPRCGTLEILDANADGVISGADRDWRYLSLWRDDGDGVIETAEVKSLFEHGVRRLDARLRTYTTAKDVDGGVWVEDEIYFDLPGRAGRATLTIDAARLARGARLWLEDASGARLDGIQALTGGLFWVTAAGERLPVLCLAVS